MKKIAILLLFFFIGLEAFAQDMIIYKDKTIDEVTIVDVTPDFVKYREYGAPINSTMFSIERDYLSKLIFESGRVMDMSKSIMDDERVYAGQRNRALKIDVAGMSGNYSFLSYEQSVDPSTSWEAGLIFVGAGFENQNGWNDPENAMGIGVNMGYKFKRSPNFYMTRMRYGHILRGAYVKPNLWLNMFNYDRIDYDHPPDPVTFQYPTSRESATAGTVMIDFGNQLVFSDIFVVDYAAGVGYGFTTKDTWNVTNYGFIGGLGPQSGTPLTFSFTLKVGYLLPGN